MELDLSADQEFFVETTDKFLGAECPLTKLREAAGPAARFDKALWRRGAELGWTSMFVPEQYGGGTVSGRGLTDAALIAELFGRHVAPGPLIPTNVVAAGIAADGDDAQRSELLPGIVDGAVLAAWCVAEVGASRRWWDVDMAATSRGGGFVLDGVKMPVEGAADADVFVVAAVAPDGLTQFVVPADAPGLVVEPLESLDLARRFGRVTFSGVELGADAVLGRPGAGGATFERQLEIALVLQCAESAGCMARVFDFTLEWAFDRFSFGRPLASYQELKHRFADMKLWLEASYATVADASRAVEDASPIAPELVSVAKAYVGDHSVELGQDCVQMHGGIGVTWEHDIHLYVRRLTQNWAMFGTPDEHRARLAELMAA